MPRKPILALGALALALGGAVVAYSQIARDDSPSVLQRAFDAPKTPYYLPVVATVNGTEIRGDWLSFQIALSTESLLSMPELAEAGKAPLTPHEALDSLVQFELAYQEAERRGLLCPDQEVRDFVRGLVDKIGSGNLQPWAEYLGITMEAFPTNPTVLEQHAKGCAVGRLAEAVIPTDLALGTQARAEFWQEYQNTLLRGARVEILDPQLQ